LVCLCVLCGLWQVAQANYDEDTSKKYTWLSASAYCDGDTIAKWGCPYCANVKFTFSGLIQNASMAILGFAGSDDNNIYIVYRGTEPNILKNWEEDFKVKEIPIDYIQGAKVHSGFWETYSSVRAQSLKAANDLLKVKPNAPVVVTGHSLGGALATLFAGDFAQTYNNIVLWTFGSPRVGDTTFANAIINNNNIKEKWRVVHNRDIVPHVPPQEFSMKIFKIDLQYHHVATEVWYKNGLSNPPYKICDGTGEDKTGSNSEIDLSVEDHLTYLGIRMACTKNMMFRSVQSARKSRANQNNAFQP